MTTEPLPPLTARESEVARLLAEGLSDAECAQILMTSVHTVRSHISHIIGKIETAKHPYRRRRVISAWVAARESVTSRIIAPAA